LEAVAMKLKRENGEELELELVARDDASVRVRVGEREIVAEVQPLTAGGAIVSIGGQRFRVTGARRNSSILVAVGPRNFEFSPVEETRRRSRGLAAAEIVAPMPGKVLNVMVKEGDLVNTGQPLAVIEAMKMETTLAAESPAVVKRVCVAAGQMVDHGAVLIQLSPPPDSSRRESAPPAS
jgi:biotin carboxyl carrier protein